MIGKSVQVSFWICIFRLFGFLSTFPLLYISHCFEEPSFLFWREINCFVKETNSQLIIIPPPFPILDYKIDTFVHKNILNIWNSINVYERNILSICNSFYRKFHKMKHKRKSREKSEKPKNTYPKWHLHRFPNQWRVFMT
jgi:hypothetical protein